MVDAVSNAAAPRVVLLARAGKAADHLAEAVSQAGAELLVTVDPATADEATLRALNPQAVLVALEPSIEHMLDKLEGLLSDPALTVIYDEADVAAHRAGWDAARWARHLSAKLRHHSNVLPPGTESDQDWQPSPGQIPKPAAAYADMDMTAFTREAVAHADSVPADGTPIESVPEATLLPPAASLIDAIPAVPPQAVPMQAVPPIAQAPTDSGIQAFQTASFETMALESADPAAHAHDATFDSISFDAFATDDGDDIENISLDSVQLDSMQLDNMQLDSMPTEDIAYDSVSVAPARSVATMRFDDDAFFLEELSVTDLPPLSGEPVANIQFDGGFDGGLDLDGDKASAFESFDLDAMTPAATQSRKPEALISSDEVMSFEALIASSLAAEAMQAAPVASQAEAEPEFSLGGLSLSLVDEAPTVVDKAAPSPATHDMSALEARISSLSLVDLDEGAADAPFGVQATPVVLVEAGLGGPDPARQLLSSLPAEFLAVVLVRLHLQGGRYDRLVAQMERTAALPVALAQSGATASAGTIYFLPDGIGLTARAGTFGFVDEAAPPAAMFAALPSGASALVFLSGSDPQLVDSAMAAAATGTLVLAHSPEDCYDGAACAELCNRGVTSGLPAELAGRLASRWPS